MANGRPQFVLGVSDDLVPLEGVIQVERPGQADAQSKLVSYAKIGLLAGGDLLCLLIFSAIGRLIHGLSVIDAEMFKMTDPFIAGWSLSAYLIARFGDDAKGSNGVRKAVTVAVEEDAEEEIVGEIWKSEKLKSKELEK